MNSTSTHKNVTAIILAGGQGRRMNYQDKGLVSVRGHTLISTVMHRLQPQVIHTIISCNRNVDRYRQFGVPVATDQSLEFACEQYPGPIAGILSAAKLVKTPYIQLCPCDTPNIPSNLVSLLMNKLTNLTAKHPQSAAPILVPHDGKRIQALHALIDYQAITSLQHYFSNGGRKMREWLLQENAVHVDFSSHHTSLININNIDDLNAFEE